MAKNKSMHSKSSLKQSAKGLAENKNTLSKILAKIAEGRQTLKQAGAVANDIKALRKKGHTIGTGDSNGKRVYFVVKKPKPGKAKPTAAGIVAAFEKYQSFYWAAYSVGLAETTFRSQYAVAAETLKPKFQITKQRDGISIVSVGQTIQTIEQALAKAEIDLRIWELKETTINSWEVAGKMHVGQNASGHWGSQELWHHTLWQVKVKLQRKAPKPIQEAIKALLVEVESPSRPRIKKASFLTPA